MAFKNEKDKRNYHRAYMRVYVQTHPDQRRRDVFHSRIKKKFGMSQEDYDVLLEKQGGVCAICKKAQESSRYKYYAVDHDHATGKVRGLLCMNCNTALGKWHDSAQTLLYAVDYLNGVE